MARVKIHPQYKLQKKISRPSNWMYKVFFTQLFIRKFLFHLFEVRA